LPINLLKATNQSVPEEFKRVSPLGKIPAFEEVRKTESSSKEDSFTTSDSDVIVRYLEQISEQNALSSKDPQENARINWFVKYGNEIMSPLTNNVAVENVIKPKLLKAKTDEAAVQKALKEDLPVVLDFLEKTLKDGKLMYIADTKEISVADIVVVTHLLTLKTANVNLDELIGKDRSNLLHYVNKILSRDSFKKVLA
jgi:glutathione S-transferase